MMGVMTMNKIRVVLCFIALLAFGILSEPAVKADDNSQKVLLVYDSKDHIHQGEQRIDSLQRILTGMNLKVKTEKASDYKKGELQKGYAGVITLINWDKAGLMNQSFEKDREEYDGIKLHIGEGITPQELQQLDAKVDKIYQKQLTLTVDENSQQLPFSQTMEPLVDIPKNAQVIGKLVTQEKNQDEYNYGVINGKNGYLPFFEAKSLSLLSATKLITQLFKNNQTFKPLLTFTGVSPYTDMEILDELSAYCEKMDIPFAISTVSVAKNTEMQAFNRFAISLRRIEDRNGLIFLNAPVIGGATKDTGTELSGLFDGYLLNLARQGVYPVGISTPGFWNQDQILRQNALKKANTWMLLPNSTAKMMNLNVDNNSSVAKKSYYAVNASSIDTIKNRAELRFNIPTAVTIAMPNSSVKLRNVKEQIRKLDLNWENPSQIEFESRINFASSKLSYKLGQYFVNESPVEINVNSKDKNTINNTTSTKNKVLLKDFFHVQGRIITVIFVVIFIVLIVFIFIGRKIYRNKFKR